MKTKSVGNIKLFTNMFTKTGRQKNNLYTKYKNWNCQHFVERTLPDGSTVGLAYLKKESPLASFAFKLEQNGAVKEKYFSSQSKGLVIRDSKNITINKSQISPEGKIVNEVKKQFTYEGNNLCSENITELSNGLITKSDRFFEYGGVSPRLVNYNGDSNDVYRVKELVGDNGTLCVMHHLDGSRTYVKEINGENYFFTTRK